MYLMNVFSLPFVSVQLNLHRRTIGIEQYVPSMPQLTFLESLKKFLTQPTPLPESEKDKQYGAAGACSIFADVFTMASQDVFTRGVQVQSDSTSPLNTIEVSGSPLHQYSCMCVLALETFAVRRWTLTMNPATDCVQVGIIISGSLQFLPVRWHGSLQGITLLISLSICAIISVQRLHSLYNLYCTKRRWALTASSCSYTYTCNGLVGLGQ